MAYRPYIWRKNNPEKRKEQKKREKIRKTLRDMKILPPVGEPMNEEQINIDNQISNNDFSYWNSIRIRNVGTGGEQKKIPIKSTEYLIWYRAKENAKKRNREFNLEIEDIVIPTNCPYLGIELCFEIQNRTQDNYYSIDRIDSSKGYVKGNIQIISRLANTMKNKASNQQLLTFAKNVLKIHKTEN